MNRKTASETVGTQIYHGLSRGKKQEVFYFYVNCLPRKTLLVYKRMHMPCQKLIVVRIRFRLGLFNMTAFFPASFAAYENDVASKKVNSGD